MSKKESEFDRLDRMRKMEREAEVTKRKNNEDDSNKKRASGKNKANAGQVRKNWAKDYASAMEENYDY